MSAGLAPTDRAGAAVPALVLASGSATRAMLLTRAGLCPVIDKPAVDEDEIKAAGRAQGWSAGQVAETLAELKARRVSARHPGALVLGADQMLDCDGQWFDKPTDRDAARAQLRSLSGRTHQLISALSIVRDGQRLWGHRDTARLTLRPLSDAALEHYLDQVGDAVTGSVGGYQVEGPGIQLFARIEGDFFTILGLPLLPLLAYLREHGVVIR